MTTAAMGFLGVVSVLAAVSAWLAELGLRRIGAPGRWVWVLGLAFGPVLLAWAVLAPSSGSSVVAGAIPTVWFELPPLVVGPESGWGDSLAEALAVVWLTLSGTAAAAVLWARAVLARAGRGWRVEHVLGHTVRVAPDLGPAVAGVVRPRIVLPEWALGLPEEHLRLVLAHEEEHVRAGDPPLLAAALTLVIGTAWNPLSWWMLSRLRRAVEIDCDGRVLRAGGDVRRYGASLLTVAARAGRSPMALAAFTERSHNLERRILAMTTSTSPRRRLIGAVSLAAALLVAAQACGGVDMVGALEQEAPPVDGIDRQHPLGVSRRPLGQQLLGDTLAIIEAAVDRDIADMRPGHGGHLPPLHLGDASVGMEDRDRRVRGIGEGRKAGRTGIARCRPKDEKRTVVSRPELRQQAGERLQPVILER